MNSLKKGFTLIELLIVIGILSVLAAGMLVLLNPAEQVKKANDTRRKSDLAQVKRALETYYQDNGRYPVSNSSGQIVGSSPVVWGGSWNPYMTVVPKDPSGFSYYYYSDSTRNNQSYYLYATLERGSKDPQSCTGGNRCAAATSINGIYAGVCNGTSACNYGVTSPDVSP